MLWFRSSIENRPNAGPTTWIRAVRGGKKLIQRASPSTLFHKSAPARTVGETSTGGSHELINEWRQNGAATWENYSGSIPAVMQTFHRHRRFYTTTNLIQHSRPAPSCHSWATESMQKQLGLLRRTTNHYQCSMITISFSTYSIFIPTDYVSVRIETKNML